MSPKPLLTVIGATGSQGGSVIDTALKTQRYRLRAVTRNPESPKAKYLSSLGVEVVKGDLNDLTSLKTALAGSNLVFASTNFFEPFFQHDALKAAEIEAQQGTNIADAVLELDNLHHFIWSTNASSSQHSGGKHYVPHFDGKHKATEYILSHPSLAAKTTFLYVAWYAQNMMIPSLTPTLLATAGKYVQLLPVRGDIAFGCIGDVTRNLGVFVDAIFQQPQVTLPAKAVTAAAEDTSFQQLLDEFGAGLGVATQMVGVVPETYNLLWPKLGEEMFAMLRFWDEFGSLQPGPNGETLLTRKDLGLNETQFVSSKELYASEPWRAQFGVN